MKRNCDVTYAKDFISEIVTNQLRLKISIAITYNNYLNGDIKRAKEIFVVHDILGVS